MNNQQQPPTASVPPSPPPPSGDVGGVPVPPPVPPPLAPQTPRGGGGKAVVIIFLLLLLAGGGVGAFYLINSLGNEGGEESASASLPTDAVAFLEEVRGVHERAFPDTFEKKGIVYLMKRVEMGEAGPSTEALALRKPEIEVAYSYAKPILTVTTDKETKSVELKGGEEGAQTAGEALFYTPVLTAELARDSLKAAQAGGEEIQIREEVRGGKKVVRIEGSYESVRQENGGQTKNLIRVAVERNPQRIVEYQHTLARPDGTGETPFLEFLYAYEGESLFPKGMGLDPGISFLVTIFGGFGGGEPMVPDLPWVEIQDVGEQIPGNQKVRSERSAEGIDDVAASVFGKNFPQKDPTPFDLQRSAGFRTEEGPILQKVKITGAGEEVDIADFIQRVSPEVFTDQTLAFFEPDVRLFYYRDQKDTWPIYALTLKQGLSKEAARQAIEKIENLSAIELANFYLTIPQGVLAWKDGSVVGNPSRYTTIGSEGASFNYLWIKDQYLIIATSFDGAKYFAERF